MKLFTDLDHTKAVIGMVHMGTMPATPFYETGSFEKTLEEAVADAKALYEGGATGCLIQTVDRLYSVRDEADPARTAAVALITHEVRKATGSEFKVGVQIMRNALQASLGVAKVAGGNFIRAGAVVGATLTAHGMVEANPLEVMTYRKYIDAMDIKVIAEIDSMHFQWFGGEKSTAEVARMAKGVGADAVSLGAPSEERTLEMIAAVRKATPDLPIILAGYTNHENAGRLLAAADGAFVGTCLERGGWGGAIDVERVEAYMDIVRGIS
jgi:uncharacterized protein